MVDVDNPNKPQHKFLRIDSNTGKYQICAEKNCKGPIVKNGKMDDIEVSFFQAEKPKLRCGK